MGKVLLGVTSVLIPLYNHEEFIIQTLNSLLDSDCSQVELVICDDASVDNSLELATTWIMKYKSMFMNTLILSNIKNRGITANLNKLVNEASGEFMTLLASDDMLPQGAIDLQKKYLESQKEIDFIFVNCSIVDKDGKLIKQYAIAWYQSFLLRFKAYIMFTVLFNWGVVWSRLFVRRSAFIKFGNYIEEHILEDRWSALKILNTKRFVYLSAIGYLYRYRGIDAHPTVTSSVARRDFHNSERVIHVEARGLLNILLWIRRVPFKTNHGKWPCRFLNLR